MSSRQARPVPPPPLATGDEVARYLRQEPHTLANWRSKGTGPRYRKVGREVLYDWADVEAWLNEQPGGPARGEAA